MILGVNRPEQNFINPHNYRTDYSFPKLPPPYILTKSDATLDLKAVVTLRVL